MPKITSVEPQKNPKRFNVFLDGEFAFGADEDLVVERRLVVGKEIFAEELEKLLFEAGIGKLMERMYALFERRQRSEKEVRDYSRIKNFELRAKDKEEIGDLAIELVIKKLKQKNLLNDKEFAKAWVESRSKKYGVNKIRQELYKKGIDRDTIEEVIGGDRMGNSEQIVQELLEKKSKRWKNLPFLEFKKKASEFLLRRGFDYKVVKNIVEKNIKKR